MYTRSCTYKLTKSQQVTSPLGGPGPKESYKIYTYYHIFVLLFIQCSVQEKNSTHYFSYFDYAAIYFFAFKLNLPVKEVFIFGNRLLIIFQII